MTLFTTDGDIVVRLFEPHHAEEAFAVMDSSREHVRPWLPWASQNKDAEEVRGFIQSALEEFARHQTMACGIWQQRQFVGGIGSHLDVRNRTASIGYWIAKEYEGRGIVTRASRAMVQYLFDERQAERVEIRCQKENIRSRGIPIRLGFQEEGTLRDAFWLYGRAVDVVVYAMLRRDWHFTEPLSAPAIPRRAPWQYPSP